jgi:hypothetical protein
MSASQPAACAGHIRTSETRMNPPMPPDANRRNSIRVAAGNCGPARRGWWIGEPSLDQASRLRLSVGRPRPRCRLSSAVEQPPCKR